MSLVECARRGFNSLTPAQKAMLNPETLDMGNTRLCVAGQLYGDFWSSPYSNGFGSATNEAIELGFWVATEEYYYGAYDWLTDAWRTLLLAERSHAR